MDLVFIEWKHAYRHVYKCGNQNMYMDLNVSKKFREGNKIPFVFIDTTSTLVALCDVVLIYGRGICCFDLVLDILQCKDNLEP